MREEKFSRRQEEILLAAADALLPADVSFRVLPRDVHLAEEVRRFFTGMGRGHVTRIGLLLLFFEYSTPLFSLTSRTFTRLGGQERTLALQGWEESRFYFRRALFVGIKTLITMVFFGIPEVEEAIGYRRGNLVTGDLAPRTGEGKAEPPLQEASA